MRGEERGRERVVEEEQRIEGSRRELHNLAFFPPLYHLLFFTLSSMLS